MKIRKILQGCLASALSFALILSLNANPASAADVDININLHLEPESGVTVNTPSVASRSATAQSATASDEPIVLGQEGDFVVDANDKEGVQVTYLGSGQGDYLFSPSGTWEAGQQNPPFVTTACGAPDSPDGGMTYPEDYYPAYSLVADCDNGLAYEVCYTPELPMSPGEVCTFKMNDRPAAYGDNTGSIAVHYRSLS